MMMRINLLNTTACIISAFFLLSCDTENGLDLEENNFQVLTTSPANGAVDVPLNTTVQAAFNDDVNPNTLDESSFSLRFEDTLSVPGTVEYNRSLAIFTPEADLEPNTEYTATITAIVENVEGFNLETDYIWTFTTAAINDTLTKKARKK